MHWRILAQDDQPPTLTATVAFYENDDDEAPTLVETFVLVRARVVSQVRNLGGQRVTESGLVVLPWNEIDGEWQQVLEDPEDPWQREDVAVDMDAELVNEIERFLTARGL